MTARPARSHLVRSTFNGLSSQYLSALVQGVVQVGLTALLARFILPEEFGLAGLATTAIGFASFFAQCGVRLAIINRGVLTDRDIRAGHTLALALGASTTIVTWLLAPQIAALLHTPALASVIRAMSVVFLLSGSGTVAEALMTRELAWRQLMNVELGAFLLGNAVPAAVLGLAGFGVWSLVAALLGQTLVRSILLRFAHPHPVKPLIGIESRRLIAFGGGFTVAQVLNYGALTSDNLVVGRVMGASALGFYTRAFKLMQLPTTYFSSAIIKVLLPVMARCQAEPARLRSIFLTGSSVIALVSAPLAALLFVTAPEFVAVLLGPRWGPAVVPLQLLSLTILPRNGYIMAYCLDGAVGASRNRVIRDGIYFTSVLIGSIAGIRWGLAGVAGGVLVAVVANYWIAAAMSRGLLALSWRDYLEAHRPGLVVGVMTAIAAVSLRAAMLATGGGSLLNLVVTGGGSLAMAASVVLIRPEILGEHGRSALLSLARHLEPRIPIRWVGVAGQMLTRRLSSGAA